MPAPPPPVLAVLPGFATDAAQPLPGALAALPRLTLAGLAHTDAELIFWLPVSCELAATTLEDLQLALAADPDLAFVLPRSLSGPDDDPFADPPASGWTDLRAETQFAACCAALGAPPLLGRRRFLQAIAPWLATGSRRSRSLPDELRQRADHGLAIPRAGLRALAALPPAPAAPAAGNSVEPAPSPAPHPRLLDQPRPIAYAPLLPAGRLGVAPSFSKRRRRHLVQLLPYLTLGGADKFALDLCRRLPAVSDWEVSVLTTDPHPNRWLAEARRHTPDVHELPALVPPQAVPGALARHLATRGADALLLTHSFPGYRLLPWLARACPQVALADYLHVEHDHWKSGGHPRFSVLYREWLDATFCSSRHLLEWCADHGHDRRGLQVVHTNLDPAEWDPAAFDAAAIRAEFGVGPDETLIIAAMRLVYQKQPELLLEVLARLEAENLPFRCLIAGDGELLDSLRRQLDARGLRRVRLLGALPNTEVQRLLAGADLFALPTMMEGIALSLFEAMAMECVPVAAAVGGQSELVTPDCGVLIDRGGGREREVEQYADALRGLIRNRDARERMKRASRRRIVGDFSLDAMAGRIAAGLERALADRAPRPTLTPSQAEVLGVEAVEHSHAQQRLDAEADALKRHFRDRLARRERKIARLEARLAELQRESGRPRGWFRRK